jgi:hypothetical protein
MKARAITIFGNLDVKSSICLAHRWPMSLAGTAGRGGLSAGRSELPGAAIGRPERQDKGDSDLRLPIC